MGFQASRRKVATLLVERREISGNLANFKIRRFRIFVDTAFFQVDATIGFYVN